LRRTKKLAAIVVRPPSTPPRDPFSVNRLAHSGALLEGLE
jgi:hypothetical protein